MSSFMHACMHAYIHILFKISSRIHKYFWSISLNVPIVRTCVSRHVLETSKYNKAIIEVNKRVREIVEYKNHAFSKTSMPKWQNTSIQERKKEKKMLKLKANYLSKFFPNLQVVLFCGHFQFVKYIYPWLNWWKYPRHPILWTVRTQMTQMAPLLHLFEPGH